MNWSTCTVFQLKSVYVTWHVLWFYAIGVIILLHGILCRFYCSILEHFIFDLHMKFVCRFKILNFMNKSLLIQSFYCHYLIYIVAVCECNCVLTISTEMSKWFSLQFYYLGYWGILTTTPDQMKNVRWFQKTSKLCPRQSLPSVM